MDHDWLQKEHEQLENVRDKTNNFQISNTPYSPALSPPLIGKVETLLPVNYK